MLGLNLKLSTFYYKKLYDILYFFNFRFRIIFFFKIVKKLFKKNLNESGSLTCVSVLKDFFCFSTIQFMIKQSCDQIYLYFNERLIYPIKRDVKKVTFSFFMRNKSSYALIELNIETFLKHKFSMITLKNR